ncbi:MAG TPA: PIN domain-containing protein [Candidatus Olsenella avicola]|nr:PIN domain-containing protein [Candidatus Olsenella avicola]
MARVVLDTNIILDYLSARRERHGDAVRLLEALFSSGDKTPVILAAGIKDAYCILCRHYHDEPLVRSRLDDFRSLMDVADLTGPVLDGAFLSEEPDLEDGIVRATAELLGAEAIVTRDSSAYRGSSVPAMDARAYCESLG